MEIVFDESKRQQNRAKHGYDFADFERCFDRDTALALPTRPSRTGRARYLFVGR
ncbi:BrnT family toxin [Methylobacterium aquaticum]|uniref:BrnT family toxin n=1 Tax=Methylobacterium aquaticum TaxID=270351 RepID=UPI001FEF0270|nr:BrnT family toxin [Methylobacterium aquaticum]